MGYAFMYSGGENYNGNRKLSVAGVADGPSKTRSLFILVEFRRSRSLVFLAVMCVSHSRFLYEGVSES